MSILAGTFSSILSASMDPEVGLWAGGAAAACVGFAFILFAAWKSWPKFKDFLTKKDDGEKDNAWLFGSVSMLSVAAGFAMNVISTDTSVPSLAQGFLRGGGVFVAAFGVVGFILSIIALKSTPKDSSEKINDANGKHDRLDGDTNGCDRHFANF